MISRIILNFWPSIITLGVILYATLASDPLPDTNLTPIPHIDKAIHAVMMGGLVGAVAFDLQRRRRSRYILTLRLMACIWLGVAIFSVLDEIAQATLTSARSGDPLDLAADLAGATAAVFLAPPAIRRVLRVR